MSLKEAQKEVHELLSQYKVPYWTPHEILARLAEETGEVAREVNHTYGPKKKKPGEKEGSVGEEMADVIFTICCMANSLRIDLDEHWKKVIEKGYERDKDRFERN